MGGAETTFQPADDAVVLSADRSRRLSDGDLRTHCRGQLAGYKVPKAFRWVDRVVRSPAGKPDYG